MHWYAKIIKFPGLSTEEYEYRYRCCDREFTRQFSKHFRGRWKGKARELGCHMTDLRVKNSGKQERADCPECGEKVPKPWLKDDDPFLDDNRFFTFMQGGR